MTDRCGRTRLVVWLLAAALLSGGSAAAQTQAPIAVEELGDARLWRHFDLTAHGIEAPPGAVVEDGRGTPWAILSDGVAYYDGLQWIRVPGAEWDADTPLNRVALARRGLLLIIDGRCLVGDETGFRQLPVDPGDADVRVTGAAEMDDGSYVLQVLEVGADGTMREPRLIRLRTGQDQPEPFEVPAPLVPTTSHGLWRSRSGALWANTVRGLWVKRDSDWRLHLPVATGEYLDLTGHDEATSGHGALMVRHPVESRGVWTWGADGPPTHHSDELRGQARAIAVLEGGKVLVTLESEQVAVIDGDRWRDVGSAGHLRRARRLFVSHRGRLWVTDPDGLHLYAPDLGLWRTLPGTEGGVGGHVNELLPRDDGSLWLATGDGLRVVEPDGVVRAIPAIGDRPLGTVTGLAEDSDGNIWISSGSSFRGVWRWNGEMWRHFGASNPALDGHFHRIVNDRDGRIWLLGLRYTGYMFADEAGVGVWVLDDGRPQRWEPGADLPSQQVYGFAEGPDGEIWFATMGGLSRYRQGGWTHWSGDDGLQTPRVFDVAVGGDRRTYFTHGSPHGVGVLERDGTVHYLLDRDGLPFSSVWRLVPEGDGLWLAGEGGVTLFRDGSFASTGLSGRLAGLTVWPLAVRGDEILAGTHGRGVATLDRSTLPEQQIRLQLERPLVDQDTARVAWSVLHSWELVPRTVIPTRYRLDDRPWSDWNTHRSIRIHNLASGEHSLTVESMGLFGTVDASESIGFRVPLPLSRNPVFYGPIYTLLVALVILGAMSWQRRKHQDQEIRRSEHRYRSLFTNASDIIFTSDLAWRVVSANPACRKALGYSTEEMESLSVGDLLAPEFHSRAAEMLQEKLHGRASTTYEVELVSRDGSRLPVELSSQLLSEGDEIVGIQGIARDIRDRKRAEETLRNIAMGVSADTGDDFFRSLVESLAVELGMDLALVGVLERTGRIERDGSPERVRTVTLWGDDGIRDNVEYDLAGSPCEEALRRGVCVFSEGVRALFPEDTLLQEEEVESYAGTPLLDSAGEPLGIMVVMSRSHLRDERLTRSILQIFAIRAAAEIEKMRTQEALQRTEEELRQAQKMEAIGRLAGGVAHDFNNLLTVVTGHAELLLAELADGDPRSEDLQNIAAAGHSAARLTTQLLALSRRQAIETVPVHPNTAIRALEPLLARLVSPDNELVLELDDRVGGIRLGAGHLEQVVMNLLVNAVDASAAGRRIFVRTRRIAAGAHGGGSEKVLLEVEDEGTGMDRETLERVFEPFFTTKEPGRGTGLGLSTVYGIVQQGGGEITIDAQPGAGTRVRMTWDAIAHEDLVTVNADEAASGSSGHEQVLVVEDEDMVRGFVRRSLERNGYRVVAVASAEEALALVENGGGASFDLLLTDVVMPGMDGVALARRVQARVPDARILLMSGYADSTRLSSVDDLSFLQKPFTPTDLARRVREALA